MKNNIAVYAGTFDPITNGHEDLILRSASLHEHLVLAIGVNSQKSNPLFTMTERFEMAQQVVRDIDNITVATFNGLLVQFAKKWNASRIVRGLRAHSDFENEFRMALANKRLAPDIETIFLVPSEQHSFISSSVVREIWINGGDYAQFVPPYVKEQLDNKREKWVQEQKALEYGVVT
jgi:pantetheine-phosphate adenylyltransferase